MIRRLMDRVGVVVVGGAAILVGVVVVAVVVAIVGAGVQLALDSPTLAVVLVAGMVLALGRWFGLGQRPRPTPDPMGPIGPIVSYPVRRSGDGIGSHLEGGGTPSHIRGGSHLSGGGSPPEISGGSHLAGGGGV
jgi:hypothetical protein